MKKFFIFLDIDGVLWDWPYMKKEIDEGRIRRGGIIQHLKPESIEALNYLIKELEANYEVNLVISSTWRYNMNKTIEILKRSGLKYEKEITKTEINFEARGIQIKEYLKDKDNYEFVIIDDELHDFKLHFDKDRIIKTDVMKGALSKEMINKYLNKKKSVKNKK